MALSAEEEEEEEAEMEADGGGPGSAARSAPAILGETQKVRKERREGVKEEEEGPRPIDRRIRWRRKGGREGVPCVKMKWGLGSSGEGRGTRTYCDLALLP